MIEIDGSYGEGGGAILRVATGLSVVTNKAFKVSNIRKNRPKPGLATQHLVGLNSAAELCSGTVKGAELGSTEIEFTPGKNFKEKVKVDIPTAGSVGLVLQTLQLACLGSPHPVLVEVRGGASWGKWAPPLEYLKNVLSIHLYRASYNVVLEVEKEGFYPVGGCRASCWFYPEKLKKFEILEQGKVQEIIGVSTASKFLEKAQVAERQKKAARQIIFNKLGISPKIKAQYVDSDCPGSGVLFWAKTDTGTVLGNGAIGERGVRAEQIGEQGAKLLVEDLGTGGAVDRYAADQLIPFLALAGGSIKVPQVTKHAETNVWVCEKFLDSKIAIKQGIISANQ